MYYYGQPRPMQHDVAPWNQYLFVNEYADTVCPYSGTSWESTPSAPHPQPLRMSSCCWPKAQPFEDEGPAPENQVFNPFLGGHGERLAHRESFDFLELNASLLLENCSSSIREPFNEYRVEELLLERPTN